MTDGFHEVEEEYRRKKLEALWKKYQGYVFGGFAVVVGGVAGLQGWNYYQNEQKVQSSESFAAAAKLFTSPGNEKKAIEALAKLSKDGTPGYRLIAQLNQAAAFGLTRQTAKAVEIYDQVAASGTGGQIFTDFARYRAALLLADIAPVVDLQTRLEPLATGNGPWAVLARELMAYSYWRGGDLPNAQKRYDLLANDATAPAGLRVRAKNMLELVALGVKPSGIAPAPSAAQTLNTDLESLLPPSLVTPEIPQGQ